ncbi:MAG: ribosomal protein S18-alanine N-acetyltransferase [Alphaproteobacteria bacterium]|nr:ribosomal protein S18-alanine N-acetyltransferase [Alphaproteobacteria bacterium]
MEGRFTLAPVGALALDVAAGLHQAAFGPMGEPTWTRQDMAGLLASPGVRGLLLEIGGRAIGVMLRRVTVDEAELLTLAVDPAHRRLGAGRALLAAAMDDVRQAGARSFFLEVGADNPAAQALYAEAGFRPVGRRAGYYPRGQGRTADAVVMRLDLL